MLNVKGKGKGKGGFV